MTNITRRKFLGWSGALTAAGALASKIPVPFSFGKEAVSAMTISGAKTPGLNGTYALTTTGKDYINVELQNSIMVHMKKVEDEFFVKGDGAIQPTGIVKKYEIPNQKYIRVKLESDENGKLDFGLQEGDGVNNFEDSREIV